MCWMVTPLSWSIIWCEKLKEFVVATTEGASLGSREGGRVAKGLGRGVARPSMLSAGGLRERLVALR